MTLRGIEPSGRNGAGAVMPYKWLKLKREGRSGSADSRIVLGAKVYAAPDAHGVYVASETLPGFQTTRELVSNHGVIKTYTCHTGQERARVWRLAVAAFNSASAAKKNPAEATDSQGRKIFIPSNAPSKWFYVRAKAEEVEALGGVRGRYGRRADLDEDERQASVARRRGPAAPRAAAPPRAGGRKLSAAAPAPPATPSGSKLVGGYTAVGPREGNEDAFLMKPPLIVVSDGMGGHAAGEVASRLTVEALGQLVHKPADLEPAILLANERVVHYGNTTRGAHGLGCTVTAAVIDENTLYIGHVGDTRVTRVNGRKLTQITTDNNVPGEMVAAGRITREEARHHPQGNMLTEAIGGRSKPKVSLYKVALKPGDVFLFTTDGVHDYLTDTQVVSVVRAGGTAGAMAQRLVEAALAADTHDNCTAVVLKVG